MDATQPSAKKSGQKNGVVGDSDVVLDGSDVTERGNPPAYFPPDVPGKWDCSVYREPSGRYRVTFGSCTMLAGRERPVNPPTTELTSHVNIKLVIVNDDEASNAEPTAPAVGEVAPASSSTAPASTGAPLG